MKTDVAIVGAGPHGIAAAALCREQGLTVRVFGHSMESWQEHMPAGMCLKSSISASNIGDPIGRWSIVSYQQATGRVLSNPLPVEDFVAYGRWVERQAAPEVDPRLVCSVSRNGAFTLNLEDGERLSARKVVLALGIHRFAVLPGEFAAVPDRLAAHAVQAGPLDRFAGKKVVVIGAGQSAQESAALLHERGVQVELITRRRALPVLGKNRGAAPALRRLVPEAAFYKVYAPTDLGRQPAHVAIAYPELYSRLPTRWQRRITWEILKPAGTRWLQPRLRGVRVTTGVGVVEASPRGDRLDLALSDGSRRQVDFALLATGFKPDLRRLDVLDCGLRAGVKQADGLPALSLGFETSVPGLHAIGAIASHRHGPITRFVCGTMVYRRLLLPALCR